MREALRYVNRKVLKGLNNSRKKIQKHRKGIVPFHPPGPTQLFQFSP
jgi:hypothetical protein